MTTRCVSRRAVLTRLGAAAAAAALRPFTAAAAAVRFGYAAITWQGDDVRAIEDISAVGFKGIQLRTSVLAAYGDRPAALGELLEKHKLTMVAFSSGNMRLDPAVERDDMATHTRHARFVRDVGGLYLQMTDTRPKDRPVVAADYRRLGHLLTELGKRTADLGIPLAYHNHMNNTGERPEEVAAVVEAADPRYVKLLLDVAHYQQGGGDPVKAITQYKDRLLLLHIKDVVSPAPGATGDLSRSYQFVELGRGKVNLPGVFAALKDVGFTGWAVVELDRVPDPARTPKDCAIINRDYIQRELHFTI